MYYRPQQPPQETVGLPRCHGRDLTGYGPCWRVPDTDKLLPNGTLVYDHYCLSCRAQLKARVLQ